jgi:hypothetical protein
MAAQDGERPSAEVTALLTRHGLEQFEPQLRALGATSALHLLQLDRTDLDGLEPPPSVPHRRAFAALLSTGGGGAGGGGGQQAAGPLAEAVLLDALRIEDALRTSEAGQQQFEQAERCDHQDWLHAAGAMQHAALIQAGARPTRENLAALRDAALRHPELARYVRYNRCREGALRVGSAAPDVALLTLAGGPTTLLHGVPDGRPLLVAAGSMS